MKALHKFLAATAAALLCLSLTSLLAQELTVNPTTLSWTATQVAEQVIYIGTDEEWEIIDYGTFIVDQTEGLGSEFVHIRPAGVNSGSTPIQTTMTVRTTSGAGAAVYVYLCQAASGGGGDPTPDPVERIALAGNWTINRTYTDAAGTSSFEDITFYDGLGYARQVVQVGASPAGGKNVVSPVWYDEMRRADAKTYLPFVSNNASRVEESVSTVFTAQSAWYEANGWSGQGDYAFSEQEYEASPLDRVVKTRKPGSTYAASVSGSKAVSIAYGTNIANNVHLLSVNSAGGLVIDGYHPAGTLHKTTVTDEDGCITITWTDVLGRTVRVREDDGDGTYMNTYYAYDDAGHLCWVVTPKGSATLGSATSPWNVPGSSDVNNNSAARHCYVYTWDGRGRQLSRKIPGKAVEYFVYDRDGRLVMSQDGLQRASSRWVTYKYDNAGRLIRRALLSSTTQRSSFQILFESSNAPSSVYPSSGDTLLDSFVYGSYTAAEAAGLSFAAVSGIISAAEVDTSRTKGLKTYEKLARLSGTGVPSAYVERAFYYDSLGRLVQTVEKNAMGTVSRYSSKYDFLGNVVASREQHGSDYKTSAFTYDARGRQLSESSSVNGSVTATMAYAYDPLGRLKTTTSGSGTNAVATTDSWNIQGWLSSRTAQKGTTNIFSMSLGYYAPVQSGATARYSGDISSWAWTQNGQTLRAYAFTYDGAHRLTAGQYYNNGTATNALSEKAISYDRAGNITSLTRYDNSGTGTTLSYSYTGNRRSGYSYDVNGNVTFDATKNLQSSYNLINLPAQIKSGDTVKAKYTYLSDGTKVAAYTSANAGRDYAGSFTYTRGSGASKTLESVAFGGGRIRRTGSNSYAVDYYITDHIGSVRAIVDATGTIQEQNDYYPFGTRHPNGLPTLSANRWRFSGKEEQDAFGIPYSDFGARLYDRTAWTAVDPLAEKYYSVSPYAYCAGNPINLSDPEGGIIRLANNKNNALDYIAQIAATIQGHKIVSDLIALPNSVTFIALPFNIEFDPSKGRIYYSNNPLLKEVDGGIMTPMLSFAHEMFHAYDSHGRKLNNRLLAEENAVSFTNYVRSNYSLKPLREKYSSLFGGDFHKFFRLGFVESISDFVLMGTNKESNTRGYRFTRKTRTATKWRRNIPIEFKETSESKYLTLTYDREQGVILNEYENEDDYNQALAL